MIELILQILHYAGTNKRIINYFKSETDIPHTALIVHNHVKLDD
jgi:hypothetical protein